MSNILNSQKQLFPRWSLKAAGLKIMENLMPQMMFKFIEIIAFEVLRNFLKLLFFRHILSACHQTTNIAM